MKAQSNGQMYLWWTLAAVITLGTFAASSPPCWSDQPVAPKNEAAELAFKTGFGHFQANNYDAALKEFDKALELQPDHIYSLFFKAVIYDRRKDYEKSVDVYDAFLKAKPDEPTALSNRATALYHVGRWAEALQSVDAALRVKEDQDVLYNKGNLLFSMAEYEKAIPILEQARRAGANIPETVLSAEKDIARQFTGRNLPQKLWSPAYDKYSTIASLGETNKDIPPAPGKGTRFTFGGSEQQPYRLLNLDVWDGAMVHDPEYGVLLSPGSKFKQIRLRNGERISVIGHIDENWTPLVDKEAPLSGK